MLKINFGSSKINELYRIMKQSKHRFKVGLYPFLTKYQLWQSFDTNWCATQLACKTGFWFFHCLIIIKRSRWGHTDNVSTFSSSSHGSCLSVSANEMWRSGFLPGGGSVCILCILFNGHTMWEALACSNPVDTCMMKGRSADGKENCHSLQKHCYFLMKKKNALLVPSIH